MTHNSKLGLGLLAAGMISLLSTTAFAGSCPADKIVANGQKPGATKPVGVDDRVIASIDLKDEGPKVKDYKFRMRRLVVFPGGTVPWHSHGERPAIIYIVSGEIVEYASTCAVPIVHKAGEVAVETHATSHWWKNHTNRRVVLLSADILHEKADGKMM